MREKTRLRGLLDVGGGEESSPMLVRVWGSSELMEPTGSTANFSWNHLSGLANLSRLLSLSPCFLALHYFPPPSQLYPQSVKVPGGDSGNRRVFCAQLICRAQGGSNLCHRFGYCLTLNNIPSWTIYSLKMIDITLHLKWNKRRVSLNAIWDYLCHKEWTFLKLLTDVWEWAFTVQYISEDLAAWFSLMIPVRQHMKRFSFTCLCTVTC